MIDLTMDEILEDLCWPGLPPGRWSVPQSPNSERNSSGTSETYSERRSMKPFTNGQNGSTASPASRAASREPLISCEPSPARTTGSSDRSPRTASESTNITTQVVENQSEAPRSGGAFADPEADGEVSRG
jgi:hypothetical protein